MQFTENVVRDLGLPFLLVLFAFRAVRSFDHLQVMSTGFGLQFSQPAFFPPAPTHRQHFITDLLSLFPFPSLFLSSFFSPPRKQVSPYD